MNKEELSRIMDKYFNHAEIRDLLDAYDSLQQENRNLRDDILKVNYSERLLLAEQERDRLTKALEKTHETLRKIEEYCAHDGISCCELCDCSTKMSLMARDAALHLVNGPYNDLTGERK